MLQTVNKHTKQIIAHVNVRVFYVMYFFVTCREHHVVPEKDIAKVAPRISLAIPTETNRFMLPVNVHYQKKQNNYILNACMVYFCNICDVN